MSAENAAENTTRREWRIAMRAAMRKVLSPISEKMIIVKERINEWNGWRIESSGGGAEAGTLIVDGPLRKGLDRGTDGG